MGDRLGTPGAVGFSLFFCLPGTLDRDENMAKTQQRRGIAWQLVSVNFFC